MASLAALSTMMVPPHTALEPKNPIDQTVQRYLDNPTEVSDLNPQVFANFSDRVKQTFQNLKTQGVITVDGGDETARPVLVALQGIIEYALTSELGASIKEVHGIIHTPMPPTPLCTEGDASTELVDQAVANDPSRLLTVQARALIIQEYLQKGGQLYAAYPEGGREKRNEEQQRIYQGNLTQHPTALHNHPIPEGFDETLTGATYRFEDKSGRIYLFSLEMTQANNPQETTQNRAWFGSTDQPEIIERYRQIVQGVCQKCSPVIVLDTTKN